MKTGLSIAALAVALIGGAPAFAQDAAAPAATAPAVEAPAAAPETPAVAAAPAATETGQVIFFRPGKLLGAALGCTVHNGDTQIARLGSGKYYAVSLKPGKHVFKVESESKDLLTLEVEAGETYYVQCSIGMGAMVGRPNLSPSDKASYDKIAAKLKPWVPKPDKS